MVSPLLQLPSELLHQICECLMDDCNSLQALSFTNKQLYNEACSTRFKKITATFSDLGALVVSNGSQTLEYEDEDIEGMMKAVECLYTQYFREIEVIIAYYREEHDNLLMKMLSMDHLSKIHLSVREIDAKTICEFLPLIPPSTQAFITLYVSFFIMDTVKRLENLIPEGPPNVHFIVHGNVNIYNAKNYPYLMARMECLSLYLTKSSPVSDVNAVLEVPDSLKEIQIVTGGTPSKIVVDGPWLKIPQHVEYLQVKCSFSGSKALTIIGESLTRLECYPFPQTVKVDGQITDLTLDLLRLWGETSDFTPLLPQNYGVTDRTDITIIANVGSSLRIKELIRAAHSTLTISYYGGDLNDLMRTLESQATNSQLTKIKFRTLCNEPDMSMIESLAKFSANMPQLAELIVHYSDKIRSVVKSREGGYASIDLKCLAKLASN